jgi:hypothetical protein
MLMVTSRRDYSKQGWKLQKQVAIIELGVRWTVKTKFQIPSTKSQFSNDQNEEKNGIPGNYNSSPDPFSSRREGAQCFTPLFTREGGGVSFFISPYLKELLFWSLEFGT